MCQDGNGARHTSRTWATKQATEPHQEDPSDSQNSLRPSMPGHLWGMPFNGLTNHQPRHTTHRPTLGPLDAGTWLAACLFLAGMSPPTPHPWRSLFWSQPGTWDLIDSCICPGPGCVSSVFVSPSHSPCVFSLLHLSLLNFVVIFRPYSIVCSYIQLSIHHIRLPIRTRSDIYKFT